MAAPAGGGEVVNIVGGGQFPKITAKSTDDFEVGVTLGTGSFGRVRFATHKVHRN
jgi:protein kinase A/protein kinase X|tara:strand:- start:1600 stop:1764 length:165 start_codon:yes stop_codon:yes gene_type:complete